MIEPRITERISEKQIKVTWLWTGIIEILDWKFE